MKLFLIFTAILALSLAEEEKKEVLEDSEAEASANIEILKEGADLSAAASQYSYVPPSQRPSRWDTPNYVAPSNTWNPPKPVQEPSKPIQPVSWVPPVQNDYYWSTGSPHYPPSTTTTPVPILQQSHYIGDNGNYNYEYQIADGTHVGEQGYFTDPKHTEESLVKKGWYSFVGADGKTYTVTYWADHTGFHAYGDHLPVAPVANRPTYGEQQNQPWKPQHDHPVQNPAPTPAPVHHPTPAPVTYPHPAPVTYPTPAPVHYPTPAPVHYPTPAPVYNPPATSAPYPTYPVSQPGHNQGYNPQVTYPHQQQQQVYYPPQQQTYPGYGK